MTDPKVEEIVNEEQIDELAEKLEKVKTLNIDNKVAIKNRDDVIKDLTENAGMSAEEADDMYKKMLQQFFAERINVDFADDGSVMSVLREIKNVVDSKVVEGGLYTDDTFFDIQDLCNKVFLD